MLLLVVVMMILLRYGCCHCCCTNGPETSDEKLMNLSIMSNSEQKSDATIHIAMNSQGFTDTVFDIWLWTWYVFLSPLPLPLLLLLLLLLLVRFHAWKCAYFIICTATPIFFALTSIQKCMCRTIQHFKWKNFKNVRFCILLKNVLFGAKI